MKRLALSAHLNRHSLHSLLFAATVALATGGVACGDDAATAGVPGSQPAAGGNGAAATGAGGTGGAASEDGTGGSGVGGSGVGSGGDGGSGDGGSGDGGSGDGGSGDGGSGDGGSGDGGSGVGGGGDGGSGVGGSGVGGGGVGGGGDFVGNSIGFANTDSASGEAALAAAAEAGLSLAEVVGKAVLANPSLARAIVEAAVDLETSSAEAKAIVDSALNALKTAGLDSSSYSFVRAELLAIAKAELENKGTGTCWRGDPDACP